MRSRFWIAIILGAATWPSVAGADFITVTNPGFETPNAGTDFGTSFIYNPSVAGQGWTFFGQTGVTAANNIFGDMTPPQGNQVGFLQQLSNIGANASMIEQSLSGFTSGSYVVSFSAGGRASNNGPNTLIVQIDGITLTFGGSQSFTPLALTSTQGYQVFTSDAVTLTAGTHVLKFLSAGLPNGDRTSFIDAVTVQTAVPEPASIASLGLGATILVLARRRGRRDPALA